MTDTLSALLSQNTRTVWLLAVEDGESAHSVPPNTPGALEFTVGRVAASQIRSNLLFAVLGRDSYLRYAQWYQQEAQKALDQAEASTRKADAPPPFDDTPPDDADWRAHTVALEAAAEDAVLEAGLLSPPYREAAAVLGPFRGALVREIVEWRREVPADPKLSSGSSEPP